MRVNRVSQCPEKSGVIAEYGCAVFGPNTVDFQYNDTANSVHLQYHFLTDTKSNQRGLTLNVDRDTEQVDHSCLEIDEVFFMWSGNLISLKMQLNQIFDRTPNQRQLK